MTYNEIKIQIEIVEIHNQKVGSRELMNKIQPSKSNANKLRSEQSDARNAATILKNMIRDFAEGR